MDLLHLQSNFFPAKFFIWKREFLAEKNLLCKEGYSLINLTVVKAEPAQRELKVFKKGAKRERNTVIFWLEPTLYLIMFHSFFSIEFCANMCV
jgi:uncharacterized protein YifE (UPF0438 family)